MLHAALPPAEQKPRAWGTAAFHAALGDGRFPLGATSKRVQKKPQRLQKRRFLGLKNKPIRKTKPWWELGEGLNAQLGEVRQGGPTLPGLSPEEGASRSPPPREDPAAARPRSVCHFSFIICSLYTGVIRDSFGFPSSRH